MPKRFFLQTVGCQMNVLDSELVAAALRAAGYEQTDTARRADVILFNTCSVRQHAEDKIYSALGRLKHLKHRHPQKIIAVLGCMAQKDQQVIIKRAPHVDLVAGPAQLGTLPELLARLHAGDRPLMAVDQQGEGSLIALESRVERRNRAAPHQALVRVMFGCNKRCSYCVVPRVRGPERSRPATEIEAEVRRLAEEGCLEVTLLGQTVNSYQDTSGGRTVRLADLLERLDRIAGLRRIRFVTNHPRHMSNELIAAVRDLDKVCPYFHVPAQSGSNRILARMRRGYTVEYYREMLARIRSAVPRAAITSDFIVGFCGESEEDFQQTVELARAARFKNSFIFKYSPRPGTAAAELFADDVPEATKRRRNNELLALQNAISREDNQSFVEQRVAILVEGPSKLTKKNRSHASSGQGCSLGNGLCDSAAPVVEPAAEIQQTVVSLHPPATKQHDQTTVQLVGRTACDRIVVFDGPLALVGQMITVEVERAEATTLFARLVR
jgi:tRNA-2-methylthio-N6-dimethylallyladenosine synthase